MVDSRAKTQLQITFQLPTPATTLRILRPSLWCERINLNRYKATILPEVIRHFMEGQCEVGSSRRNATKRLSKNVMDKRVTQVKSYQCLVTSNLVEELEQRRAAESKAKEAVDKDYKGRKPLIQS